MTTPSGDLIARQETTLDRVIADLRSREERGIAKYGMRVDENPLSHREWLQHAYEEALDLAIYLKRAMGELP